MKLISLFFVLLFMSTSLFSDEIKWSRDFQTGMIEAKKQNKPVLFVFSRHTCHYCVVLEETTFKDERVIKMLNEKFISIVSYTDENDYTPRALWRPGTPTMWFLKPDSEPMFQPLIGAVGADKFYKGLQIVHQEFANETRKNK